MRVTYRISLVLASLVLGLFVCLTAAWNLRVSPARLGIEAPAANDPRQVFAEMRTYLLPEEREIPRTLREDVARAAHRDPLASEYLLLEGLDREQALNDAGAIEALELAQRRDPRDRIVRSELIDAYLREGRARKAIKELAALSQIERAVQNRAQEIAEILVITPSTRAETIAALAGTQMEGPVMRMLARRLVPVEILSAFALQPAEDGITPEEQRWIASLVDPYVRFGNYDEAEEIWRHFNAVEQSDFGGVTDAAFTGQPGPPFGWQLERPNGGIAELSQLGLQVSYFGREGWVIARQLLRLEPGSYRLTYDLGGSGRDLPNLAFRLDCLESGATLLDFPLNRESLLGLAPSDIATVPDEGCPAQWLVLTARPEEPARSKGTTIRAVNLEPWNDDA